MIQSDRVLELEATSLNEALAESAQTATMRKRAVSHVRSANAHENQLQALDNANSGGDAPNTMSHIGASVLSASDAMQTNLLCAKVLTEEADLRDASMATLVAPKVVEAQIAELNAAASANGATTEKGLDAAHNTD